MDSENTKTAFVAELVAERCDLPTVAALMRTCKSVAARVKSSASVWEAATRRATNGARFSTIAPATSWYQACYLAVSGLRAFPSNPAETVFGVGDWRVWSPASEGPRSTFVWAPSRSPYCFEFPWDSAGFFRVIGPNGESWTIWSVQTSTRDAGSREAPHIAKRQSSVPTPEPILVGDATLKSGWVSSRVSACGGTVSVRIVSGATVIFPAHRGLQPVFVARPGTVGVPVTTMFGERSPVAVVPTVQKAWHSKPKKASKLAMLQMLFAVGAGARHISFM